MPLDQVLHVLGLAHATPLADALDDIERRAVLGDDHRFGFGGGFRGGFG